MKKLKPKKYDSCLSKGFNYYEGELFMTDFSLFK